MADLKGALARAMARQNGTAPPTPTEEAPRSLIEPQVPMPDEPDPEGAESSFFRTAYDRYSRLGSGPEAAAKAARDTAAIRALPSDIPAKPTLGEQAAISFRPAQLRDDDRPPSASEM